MFDSEITTESIETLINKITEDVIINTKQLKTLAINAELISGGKIL